MHPTKAKSVEPILTGGEISVSQHPLELFFPDDLKPTQEMIRVMPNWLVLDRDGTLPKSVKLPSSVKLPRYITLPARTVAIPDGKGGWQTVNAPAATIDMTVMSTTYQNWQNDLHSRAYSIDRSYHVRVVADLFGHCDDNYALFYTRARAWSHTGTTPLPNWTNEGYVWQWGFHQTPANPKLCIPKSLYWIYIGPLSGNPLFWLQLGLYNSPYNWGVGYHY